MPYRTKTLAGATPAALAEEVRAELDAAFTANASWSKVTAGYTGNTNWNFIDVWQNSGANSGGYPWFIVVARSSTTANTLLGGALEYSDASKIARKSFRAAAGYVNAEGFPVTAAGGSTEVDFPLSAAAPANSATVLSLGHTYTLPTVPVAGNWLRTLVTDTAVWYAWGSATTLVNSHGIGTYEPFVPADAKPLALIGSTHSTSGSVGSTWRDPSNNDPKGYIVENWNTTYRFGMASLSQMSGEVGGISDLHLSGPVGSRVLVTRTGGSSKESPTSVDARGGMLGIAPDDFLLFDRANGVQIGDTITVGGKVYVSVDTPGASSSLFVNTQPTS